ncbi:conserved exported protein of unknown function [Burkholderia multivorans]
MKFFISVIAMAAAITPALASAHSQNEGLTRAQVEAQLVQIEEAGYNPAQKDNHYPQSIQQAEARIHSTESAAQLGGSGYGYAQRTAEEAGHATAGHEFHRSLYAHH